MTLKIEDRKYLNSLDSYKTYKKMTTLKKPIQRDLYVKIVNDFMQFLMKEVWEKGSVILPNKMGKLEVKGTKVKVKTFNGEIRGLAPDWVETKKLWEQDEEAKKNKKVLFHFNEQTEGVRYKYCWVRNGVAAYTKDYYNLILSRTNKRTLAELIRSGKEYNIEDYKETKHKGSYFERLKEKTKKKLEQDGKKV